MKSNINLRVIVLYIFVCGIAFMIVSRVIMVQRLDSDISTINIPKLFKMTAPRGNIFSDDGSLLAISMPLYNVFLDMSVMDSTSFNNEVSNLSSSLSLLFKDKTANEYEKKLRECQNKKKNKYIKLRTKVTHNELTALKKFPILKLGKYKGGLIAEKRPNRENPFGILAKRTIGLLRESNPIGIERAYNKTLSGVDGWQLRQNKGKNFNPPIESPYNVIPQPGNDIVTTINIDMQDVAENALSNALLYHNADWGTVVLMEVESGHVKVIANLKNNDGELDEYYNHAIAEHSEPGSTFKLASVLAGLEDGFYRLTDSVDTEDGTHKFYNEIMRDSKKGGYGKITIGDAFVYSSNVGISKITDKYYRNNPNDFIDRIYKMGLCDPLDLELPYPNSLLIKKPGSNGWSGVTLPWMSIGYSLRLTPIHILTFYNAVANNGVMVLPLFTSSILKDGKKISSTSKKIINPAICSKASLDAIKPYLIDVVEKGTARSIRNKKYKIAGKTGTTLLAYGDKDKKKKKQYQASFVGFFPANKPKYSCIVVVNNPKENGLYGGNVAAPVFKEISDKLYASDISLHKSIEFIDVKSELPNLSQGNTKDANFLLKKLSIKHEVTNSNWMVPTVSNNQITLSTRNIENDFEKGVMPNLYGMNLMDAVYLLENFGLEVMFSGRGYIIDQSIEKGELIHNNTNINLEASL